MDPRRLADIRAGDTERAHAAGSGYLLGGSLVLTARHAVVGDAGRVWPRIEVWLGHPGGARRRVGARLVWWHRELDAALLRLDEADEVAGAAGGVAPARWGWFATAALAACQGWGFIGVIDYERPRRVGHLGGTLSPLMCEADGYVLDRGTAAPPELGWVWRGASGAAVFSGGLLVGVVTADDRMSGGRQPRVAPVQALLASLDFRRLVEADTGRAPELEAVEFAGVFQPPAAPAATPGSLLAACVEAVAFTGRERELAALTAWRDDPARLAVLLVSGTGGQGKTRLARELVARSRAAGWVAGFAAAGDTAAREIGRLAGESLRPALVVIDHAEPRLAEFATLRDALRECPPAQPVRLVLLARQAGSWWDNLVAELGGRVCRHLELGPLTEDAATRRAAYAAAVTGLADHLATLPTSPLSDAPTEPWPALAARLAVTPSGLGDERPGTALTLQMIALRDLLAAAGGHPATGPPEADLLDHERDYLRRAAVARGLLDLDTVSDDDTRRDRAWRALERALAGLILLGPCAPERARAVAALAYPDRVDEVAGWLADLYPPAHQDHLLGAVRPDRLAELLLGSILTGQDSLVEELAELVEDLDTAHAALDVLVRAAAHPAHARLVGQVGALMVTHPDPFAVAAPAVAATSPYGDPLWRGLMRLGGHDPVAFRAHALQVADLIPQRTMSGRFLSAALIAWLTEVLRLLADTDPEGYRPDLARSLRRLGAALSTLRRFAEALSVEQEAIAVYRGLVDADPDTYRPELAVSLYDLGVILSGLGRSAEALLAEQEAVATYRELAETDPARYRADLSDALYNIGITFSELGRHAEALPATQEAAAIRRELAETDPDRYRPALAAAQYSLGVRLIKLDRLAEALPATEQAATMYRELAETDPARYRPSLANTLHNIGVILCDMGRVADALPPEQEAVAIYRDLAETDPDGFRPELAHSLRYLGVVLGRLSCPADALPAEQEAVAIYRDLAETDPDGFRPELARSLYNLGITFSELGRHAEALPAEQEAVAIYRELIQAHPGTYRPALAAALDNLGVTFSELGRHAEALPLTQEAAAIRRELAEADPDTYRPALAYSLHSLGSRLSRLGRLGEALSAAQEATATYRSLAETDPHARLHLARSLSDLALLLGEGGEHQAALFPAHEATVILRDLVSADPESHRADLARSLRALSDLLAEQGRGEETGGVWQDAVTAMPDASSRLALRLDHAEYLIDRLSTGAGVVVLADVLATADLPGPTAARAHELLRRSWRHDPATTRGHWREVTGAPEVPTWMRLPEAAIQTVIDWINTDTWEASRVFLHRHADELLAPRTDTVLDELALRAPDLVAPHRRILAVARADGIDAAYQRRTQA